MHEHERLSGVDAAWLHMDRPANTADVIALVTFPDRLPRAALRRAVERRLLGHPRFRQRVVADGPLGLATWEDDPGFSLDRHLVHASLPRGGTRSLQTFASAVATEPLDGRHPLWRVFLVDGFGAGSAIVAKLHHCMADGFALVGVLLSLADDLAPDEGRGRGAAPDDRPPGGAGAAARSALRDPGRLARRGLAFARALGDMALLPPDPPSSLRRPLSGRRRSAFSAALPLPALRARARALRATVNDLLLAALAGALRAHLEGRERVGSDLRALVPVNLRPRLPSARDGAMGNCFGLVFLPLPVGTGPPLERLARVHAGMAAAKRSPDALVTYAVLDAIGHLPRPLEHFVTEFFSRKASLVVTNVPGPRARLHLAGHEIDRIMFNVPHPATLGLGVSILSYAGEVRIGVRADVAVMPDPGAFVRRFAGEVEALRAS